jgi:hypothetical protein
LEFSELLKKLPVWNRTQYYCFISELLNVSTGQSITNDFLETYKALTGNTISKSITNISPEIFKLGRYQIAIADKEDISWQTFEGLGRIIGGHCSIESDLLLIGPEEYEEGNQKKRAFLDKLNKLPKWDKTMAWCRSAVLHPCSVEPQITGDHNVDNPNELIIDRYSFDEKPSQLHFDRSHFNNQYKKPPKQLSQYNFKLLETVWTWINGRGRALKYLIPLFLIGLLFSLLLIWFSVEKKSLFPHGGKQHHRDHHD